MEKLTIRSTELLLALDTLMELCALSERQYLGTGDADEFSDVTESRLGKLLHARYVTDAHRLAECFTNCPELLAVWAGVYFVLEPNVQKLGDARLDITELLGLHWAGNPALAECLRNFFQAFAAGKTTAEDLADPERRSEGWARSRSSLHSRPQELIEDAANTFKAELSTLVVTYSGRWVAYHGTQRIGFGDTEWLLRQHCSQRGYTDAELFVAKVE